MGTPASCFSPPCDSLPTAVPCLRGGGSQCRAMGQPEPWGCRQPGSSRGDGNIQVCPAWSRERAVTDHAAPRHFSLHLREAAAAENRARGGDFRPWGAWSRHGRRAGLSPSGAEGMVHAGSCWVVLPGASIPEGKGAAQIGAS